MFHSRFQASTALSHLASIVLLILLLAGTASSQKRDTVWVGYDRGKADSLITYDGHYIGTAYAHQVAGWQYALKLDLTLFGVEVQTKNFEPMEMSFNVFPSRSGAGIKSRAMTAFVWEDSSAQPGRVLASIPFSMIHTPLGAETLIVLNLRPFRTALLKKNPIWIGFEEGDSTGGELFTWMRSSYAPNTTTKSYDRPDGGRWLPITQPVYWESELRPSYNLFFQVRYVGDTLTAVEPPPVLPSTRLMLAQNAPNPFSTRTLISFFIRKPVPIARLEIFDALGRKIALAWEGAPAQGWNSVNFNASRLTPGLYLCVLSAGEERASRPMILAR